MPENETLILMAITLSKGRNFSTVKLAKLIGCTPLDILTAAVSLAEQGRIELSVPKTLPMSIPVVSEETGLVTEASDSGQSTWTAPIAPEVYDDECWYWE